MKKILYFWFVFFVFFFSLVIVGFWTRMYAELIIILLFLLYGVFQGICVIKGWRNDVVWIYSAIVVQLLFAVLSPLYYSNFGDPVSEFLTGQWFDSYDAYDPCQLCWWARILMFPLLPLMIFYITSRNRSFLWYIYGASGVGILLESFHYLLQKTNIPNPFGCTVANPCSALGVEYFGFITIPFLCLIAFGVVHILVVVLLFSRKFRENIQ